MWGRVNTFTFLNASLGSHSNLPNRVISLYINSVENRLFQKTITVFLPYEYYDLCGRDIAWNIKRLWKVSSNFLSSSTSIFIWLKTISLSDAKLLVIVFVLKVELAFFNRYFLIWLKTFVSILFTIFILITNIFPG